MLRNLVLSLAAVLAVSACAVPSPYQAPSPHPGQVPPQEQAPVETRPGSPPAVIEEPKPLPPTAPEPTLSPASRALVSQAQTQLVSRNYPVAASLVERALRIEPDNPLLWIELGKVRQAEGNYVQAENMARRAITTAANAPRVQASAWSLVAESYRARGRNTEAQEAQTRADAVR